MRAWTVALALTCAVVMADAQQLRDQGRITLIGTASVSGTVVLDDETRPPMRRATVTLNRQGLEDIRTATTDDSGRYAFSGVPAGTYILYAGRGGHLTISHGAAKAGMAGQAIVLRDGQSLTLPPVAVPKGGVIAGRVVDRLGHPAPNLGIQAVQFVTFNGERRRRTISGGAGSAVTDQHGDYRMYGLQPGSYVVFATPASGVRGTEMIDTTPEEVVWAQRGEGQAPHPAAPVMYVPTLFPGVTDSAAAVAVELGKGDQRIDTNFTLQFVAVGMIRGTVTGPDGAPMAGVRVARQSSQSSPLLPTEMPSAATDANGRFTMMNVAPGTYVVTALGMPASPRVVDVGPANPSGSKPGSIPMVGQDTVSVASGSAPELSIRLQPAPAVSGAVVATGDAKAEGARVTLVAAASGAAVRSASASIDASNRFRLEGVLPGSYRLTISALPRGTRLLSAMMGEVDVLDVPFDVTLGGAPPAVAVTVTDVPTSLSGRLIDAAGAPVSSLYVMAFSTTPSHWSPGSRRIVSLRAGADGSFLFDTLPPGEYFVCALTELDPALQSEPTFLQELIPASIRIKLADGQAIRQDLRVGSGETGDLDIGSSGQ
jgi:hypothetical protein